MNQCLKLLIALFVLFGLWAGTKEAERVKNEYYANRKAVQEFNAVPLDSLEREELVKEFKLH